MGRVAPEADMWAVSPAEPAKQPAKERRKPEASDVVWQTFEVSPAFFDRIEMAEDGGFNELHILFDMQRFFWATLTVLCLLMNLSFIIVPNVYTLITVPVSDWITDKALGAQRWLIINSLIGLFLEGDKRVNGEVMLAFLELGMLLYYLCRAASCFHKMGCRKGYERWHGAASFFWDLIPEMSVISAMKSLNFVTPQVLAPELMMKVRRASLAPKDRRREHGLALAWFLLGVLLHFFIGFEAFMIKFTMASSVVNASDNMFDALFESIAFLNQLLGVVNVQKFSHRRLFVFIFGGEDGFLSKREEQIAATWLGMLAKRMWQESGRFKPKLAWFLTLALSYGDSDFQMLVLNEEAKRKQKGKDRVAPV